MDSNQQPTGKRGLTEWAALGGVAFVVLFITGLYFMFNGAPDLGGPPDKIIAYFSDSGHRDRIVFGWALVSLGLLSFLFFVASLRQTVSRFDSQGILTTLTTLGGAIYATLALAAVALESGVGTMSDDTYQHKVYPELLHAVGDAGYVLHATGGVGLSVMILAASIAFIRSGVVPKWAGWLGVVVALAALATAMFITVFVWLAWILVVAVVLFWKGSSAGSQPAGASS
jgi:hypothetical protein